LARACHNPVISLLIDGLVRLIRTVMLSRENIDAGFDGIVRRHQCKIEPRVSNGHLFVTK
jgi:DNA-binding FadR family transcriptional regulator